MTRVDYDSIAADYDERYARNDYRGVADALTRFLRTTRSPVVLEVGCGTGHWLAVAASASSLVTGVDRSWEMLRRARRAAPRALIVHGTAEQLPWASQSMDRVFCINAFHHFADKAAFLRECRRVLRPGGAFLTVAIDPHIATDKWWIYDYFPTSLEADRRRYASTDLLRRDLLDLGFAAASTEVVQHMPAERSFDVALARGSLERSSTSQLMVISDAEYESGIARLRKDRPVLRSDLRLYGTVATLSARAARLTVPVILRSEATKDLLFTARTENECHAQGVRRRPAASEINRGLKDQNLKALTTFESESDAHHT
ncbi:MAG TPA: class I SAM-dependent methyltransferase [Gemmatimonadaceae bacterium]|jgi:ubiquinone/menaquinone biosynthesis C-methylase UbiE